MENASKIRYHLKTSVMLGSFAFGFMSFILPIYSKRIGGNALTIGGLFSIFSVVALILRPFIGKGTDKYGRVMTMAIVLIASGTVSLGLTHIHSIEILVVLWALESIGIVMASPAQEALVADMAGEDIRGSAYGMYLFTASLGVVIGPLIGGWLYDSFGHAVPFYLNGIILLFDALLAVSFFGRYKKAGNRRK